MGTTPCQGTVTLPVFHYMQDNPEVLAVMISNQQRSCRRWTRWRADRLTSAVSAIMTRQRLSSSSLDAKALLAGWPDSIYRQALSRWPTMWWRARFDG